MTTDKHPTKDAVLIETRGFLQKLYEQNQKQGLLSIYLWGSIVTDDYRPVVSDIDAMGIIDSKADEKNFVTDKNILSKLGAPPGMGFQVLYLDELEKGEPRGWMGHTIHPRRLLLDFPAWVHVAGSTFKRHDFPIDDLNANEAVAYIVREITNRHYGPTPMATPKAHHYMCKLLFRLCYQLNQLEATYPFSYSNVSRFSNVETQKIIEPLTKLREKQWNLEDFRKHEKLFQEFVESTARKFS
jgi:hypothetical protein